MKKSGLTEKRMANKLFRTSEHAIFIAYFKLKDYASAKRIAKAASVSRATLYRHHCKIQSIPKDYEKYLLSSYIRKIRPFLNKKEFSLKNFYLRTLVFISNHEEIFSALFSEGRKEIITKMLSILKPKLTKILQVSNRDKVYIVYTNEILGIIEIWSKQHFSLSELNQVLNDILYLTETASDHLTPL